MSFMIINGQLVHTSQFQRVTPIPVKVRLWLRTPGVSTVR